MPMAVIIGAKPDGGFDDPIGMLKDCHRRIESFLGILCLVCRQAKGRTLSDEEQSAIESALRYFSVSGPRHNQDEEQSVFPRLREMGESSELDEVRRLETEHREAGILHDQVAELYNRWITDLGLDSDDEERLLSGTTQLNHLYEEHIRIEEGIVFPRAAELFDQDTVLRVGAEFKARREPNS
jgi:hemerythrin-like domain-containing protein